VGMYVQGVTRKPPNSRENWIPHLDADVVPKVLSNSEAYELHCTVHHPWQNRKYKASYHARVHFYLNQTLEIYLYIIYQK